MSDSKAKILCVDDDQDTLNLLALFLRSAGYKVFCAATPELGLEMSRQVQPDLVLLDLMMPGMNGFEVCGLLQRERRDNWLPVLFLSASSQERDKALAFAAGGADYLVKPTNKSLLLTTVQKHLCSVARWSSLAQSKVALHAAPAFAEFRRQLAEAAAPQAREAILALPPRELYRAAELLAWSDEQLAQCAAEFIGWEYRHALTEPEIAIGALPPRFCRSSQVVPLVGVEGENVFALANPFDLETTDVLVTFSGTTPCSFVIAPPGVLRQLLLHPSYD